MNPDRQIYVLITAPVNFLEYPANPFVRAILSYSNVHLKYFDVIEITQQTPLEQWIRNSTLFESIFLNVHVSDVYRYVVLWRYEGIYLDLDALVLQNFDGIPENFACIEQDDHNQIGNAFLGFKGDVGRRVMELCLKWVRNLNKFFNIHNANVSGKLWQPSVPFGTLGMAQR